jgi:predicted O-methyltransferase YrrM
MCAKLATPPDLTAWIARLYRHPELLRMGHNQSAEDLNLGLGWIYYGVARLVRPARAVVIGSHRGFVPMVIARACQDNGAGSVTFIDPSRVDDFWCDPARTRAWFREFGLDNIDHHLATTQEFVQQPAFALLADVGLLFVDGYHTAEQARIDHEAFAARLAPSALVLFHDSMVERISHIYGESAAYTMDVGRYLDELRADPALQLFDLPFGTGLTLLRRRDAATNVPFLAGVQHRVGRGPGEQPVVPDSGTSG